MRFYVIQVSESHENESLVVVVVPDVDVVINGTPTARCIRQRDSLVAQWNKTTNDRDPSSFRNCGPLENH